MNITETDIEDMRDRVIYNSTDMGELGTYIRVEYVMNIIDVMVRWCEMREKAL